jgi:hypothetical protein
MIKLQFVQRIELLPVASTGTIRSVGWRREGGRGEVVSARANERERALNNNERITKREQKSNKAAE